jgi:multidrug resistance efflux pump
MDLLLILTYAAFCIALFKIFRIPLNKWTVPTAVLGGVVLIGALIFTMNYNHPYSEVARSYFVSVPVIPVVSGLVVEVPVQSNQLLAKPHEVDQGTVGRRKRGFVSHQRIDQAKLRNPA